MTFAGQNLLIFFPLHSGCGSGVLIRGCDRPQLRVARFQQVSAARKWFNKLQRRVRREFPGKSAW